MVSDISEIYSERMRTKMVSDRDGQQKKGRFVAGQHKKYRRLDSVIASRGGRALMMVGLVAWIFTACRKNRFLEEKHADGTGPHALKEVGTVERFRESALKMKNGFFLDAESSVGKVTIKAIPLGSSRDLGPFWRAKNLKVTESTSLAVVEDLLGTQDGVQDPVQESALESDPVGAQKVQVSDGGQGSQQPQNLGGAGLDDGGLSTPEGMVFFLKKIEFMSDEALVPGKSIEPSKKISNLVGADKGASQIQGDLQDEDWSFKLNKQLISDLVDLFGLPDDEHFESFRDKIYTNPDQLLLDLEVMLKDRANLVISPHIMQKSHEIIAQRLEDMVWPASPRSAIQRPVSPPGDWASESGKSRENTRTPTTFGPFRVELKSSGDPGPKSLGRSWVRDVDLGLVYKEGGDHEIVSSLNLAPGIYRSVRLTWGAIAQVKGCVREEAKEETKEGVGEGTKDGVGEVFCTKGAASPYVTNATLSDMRGGVPESMDVPTSNDDLKWPLSGDWVREYAVDLEVVPGSVHELNLVYPLVGAIKFYKHDTDLYAGIPQGDGSDRTAVLLPNMPRNRPYFYMPELRERMQVTSRPLGRLYEFAGHATTCLKATNRTQPDCTAPSSAMSASVLQILTDPQGAPMKAIWQWIPDKNLFFPEQELSGPAPSLWIDSFSSAARGPQTSHDSKDSRSWVGREVLEDETVLWFHPAGSSSIDGGDGDSVLDTVLLGLEGMPLALDKWAQGETKTLWAKLDPVSSPNNGPGPSDARKSSRTRLAIPPKETPVPWVRVQLKRLL